MVNIWMENLGRESDTGRLFGVALTKCQPQTENTTFPWGLIGPKYGGAPHEQVIIGHRTGAATLRRLVYDGFEIGHEPELSRRRSHIVFKSRRWVLVLDQNRSRGLYSKSQNEKTRLFSSFKWWGWVGGEWWWMRAKGFGI